MLAKFVDSTKVITFIYFLIGGIVFCWLLFYFLSKYQHGIVSTVCPSNEITWFDSFYFSVVTVSSLGYGDFRPEGVGRVVAIVEVLYGLLFLALIVSKLASERTSALTKLLYASDTQRRLFDFKDATEENNQEMLTAISEHNYQTISDVAIKYKMSFSTYKHFINYHFKHGSIGNEWDSKLLFRLLKNTSESIELANKAMRSVYSDADLHQRFENYINRAVTLSEHIIDKYENKKMDAIHSHILKQKTAFDSHRVTIINNPGHIIGNSKPTELPESLLERVALTLPKRPWSKHVHKDVARKLKISKKLASKAISELISRGRY